MGKKVRIQLAPADRDRLEALIANGNMPQKHARRARIVFLAVRPFGADGRVTLGNKRWNRNTSALTQT